MEGHWPSEGEIQAAKRGPGEDPTVVSLEKESWRGDVILGGQAGKPTGYSSPGSISRVLGGEGAPALGEPLGRSVKYLGPVSGLQQLPGC